MTSSITSVSVFENKATGMDAVVDLVGGETLSRSYAVVKKGGVLATTVQPIDESAAKRAGIRAIQVVMKRNAADLAELARLVERGALKPRLDKTMTKSVGQEWYMPLVGLMPEDSFSKRFS